MRDRARIGITAASLLAVVAIAAGIVLGIVASRARPARASAAACTRVAVQAVRHRATLTGLPAPCRGLLPGELHAAAVAAVDQVAGTGRKVIRRHRAAQASARLAVLVTAAQNATRPRPGQPNSGGANAFAPVAPAPGSISLGAAALLDWLAAALTGGWLLLGWLRHGGMRRRRTPTGLPPAVILGHFALAVTGLLAWIGYLASGVIAVAWVATALLLPVGGLGIATLTLAIPETGRAARPAAAAATGGAALAAGSGPAAAPAALALAGPRPKMPTMMIAAHGVFAFTTIMLAILATIEAAAR
ncbi:MAG: hypothetical protein M0030_11110 [Actinomycetota bacterium]|nr:hypothetical protein [Actinomycetota bacterium]